MRRPKPNEAASYYDAYINLISSENIVNALQEQMNSLEHFLNSISEEQSIYRYAPGKWTIRQVLNHVNDGERIFSSRLLWFARGFQDPLPSFDQEVCTETSGANEVSWRSHVDEFHSIRLATLSLVKNLPTEAWDRTGTASGYEFTVRALAYIIAGHAVHHQNVLKRHYLPG